MLTVQSSMWGGWFIRCLLLSAAVVTSAVSSAQQGGPLTVQKVTARNGALQSAVYSLMQDKYGYMWFGTRSGLERFDGYDIYPYHFNAQDSTGLSGHIVTAITEDSTEAIWAGTSASGVNRLDRRTQKFTHFRHDPHDAHTLRSDNVASLVTDKSGDVWIMTDRGVDRYRQRSRTITRYDVLMSVGITDAIPTSLYVDRRGNVWVCASDRTQRSTSQIYDRFLCRFDAQKNTFVVRRIMSVDHMRYMYGKLSASVIGEQADGNIILGFYKSPDHISRSGTSGSLVVGFDQATDTFRTWSNAINNDNNGSLRRALLVDEAGTCLYTSVARSRSGPSDVYRTQLFVASVFQQTPNDRKHRASPSPLLTTTLVRSAIRDRSGTFWITTEDGVFRISSIGAGFTSWRHEQGMATSLSASRIRSIHVDNDESIWVSTDLGLDHSGAAPTSWRRLAGTNASYQQRIGTANVIYRDRDSTMLLGTTGGVFVFNAETFTLRKSPRIYRDLNRISTAVWSLLRDNEGRLWVGSFTAGLFVVSADGNSYDRYVNSVDNGSLLPGGIWCIIQDRRGTIWVGTNGGLCRWMPSTASFRRYLANSSEPRALAGNMVWDIFEDAHGVIWCSSFAGGISRYDPATDDFTSFTTRDGLPTNDVFGILEDNAANFWISTSKGLVKWDRVKNTFNLYDVDDGLQGAEFAFKAHTKSPSGRLYFGGTRGLTSFRPEDLQRNHDAPPVVITGLRIIDSLAYVELRHDDTVRLAYDQAFFSIEFAALNYINAGKNSYAYMLEGVDPAWVHTNSDHRFARYTDLDPGTYVFRVRGSNNDHVWNDDGASVTVIIAPPWWQTWWFRAASLTSIIGLIIGGVAMRFNSIRRHEHALRISAVQAALASQEHERQRIARDLHDGIGQLLAAANVNLLSLRDQVSRKQTDDMQGSDVYRSIDRTSWILSRASDDVRALSHGLGTSTLRELGLNAALDELFAHMDVLGSTRIALIVVGMESRLSEDIEVGLFRIAQELVGNVIHHAHASEASVQVIRQGPEVRLEVEDDGIGFDMTTDHHGMGLQNVAARVAAMHGKLHFDSKVGHGTTVTIAIDVTQTTPPPST